LYISSYTPPLVVGGPGTTVPPLPKLESLPTTAVPIRATAAAPKITPNHIQPEPPFFFEFESWLVVVAVSPALMLTTPVGVVTAIGWAELTTVKEPELKFAVRAEPSKLTTAVEFGANLMLPAAPQLRIAEAVSEVTIVLPEKIVRPERAVCPSTVTMASSEPDTRSSPEAFGVPAKATIEYVANIATIEHVESALRIHSLLFIFLLFVSPNVSKVKKIKPINLLHEVRRDVNENAHFLEKLKNRI